MMCRKPLTSLALLVLLGAWLSSASAQDLQLTGTVRDLNTHREIENVNVFVEGTRLGTSTDHAGRFKLGLPPGSEGAVLVFRHVGYEPKRLTISDLRNKDTVYLQPRVVPLQGVAIEETALRELEIERDLPQTVATIESRRFEIRGFVDAGDLLRTDHSVQVEEELSGEKTISIRGGNSDDVLVLYNGVEMNSAYDNVFDLSLIDLEDIERFEIIKGSNTALYGPEAFSGVVNIVPKMRQDYTLRFQQRLGTYRSGNWGVHFYQELGGLHANYSYKRGGMRRSYVDAPDSQDELINDALHHNGSLVYEYADGRISGLWFRTETNYENRRFDQQLSRTNQMFSLQYEGRLFGLRDLHLALSRNDQKLNDIEDDAYHFTIRKGLRLNEVELLLGYQFERSDLDFVNDVDLSINPSGLKRGVFERRHHGFTAIVKYHGETGSDFFKSFDVQGSVRHDIFRDEQKEAELFSSTLVDQSGSGIGIFDRRRWQDTVVKLAASLDGYRRNFAFHGFLSFGGNIKFPSLFQQISSPASFTGVATRPNLSPEYSRGFELGVGAGRDVRGSSSIYGWEITASLFQTYYDNKFREFKMPGFNLVFYDNVQTARISGVESTASLYLLRKKITLELGLSEYFISEKAAFPFKSDAKRTISLIFDHAGYSLQIFAFTESGQVALLRQPNHVFAQAELPDYTNLDVHLSKTLSVGQLELFVNFSGRNLLDDEIVDLEGLAIRDRRFYLTFGAQY